MKVKNKIKSIAADKDIKMGELAKMLGTNPNVFAVELCRGIGRIQTLERILDKMDCDLVIMDRKTGKIY